MNQIVIILSIFLCFTVAQDDRSARIIGGRNADITNAPYQVSLRPVGSNFHFCGGALISNRWVVTAAECVVGRALNSVNVLAGTSWLTTGGIVRRSSNIIIHHSYNQIVSRIDHNIGLIQTGSAFTLSTSIMPARLDSPVIREPTAAKITGFGPTSADGSGNSDRLQLLDRMTITDAQCSSQFTSFTLNTAINLCTDNDDRKGFCKSDIGGPLVPIVGSNLIGIASWNDQCATGLPDVYVRISFYRHWIGSWTGV